MNLSLFLSQLNQLLQNTSPANCLLDVCELLRSHICAAITLSDQNNHPIVELLQPDTPSIFEEHRVNQPIIAGNTTIGNLNICRIGDPFTQDENLGIGVAFSICILLLRNKNTHDMAENQRRREVVRTLINTLSFSELEATTEIIRELSNKNACEGSSCGRNKNGFEGLIIAGNIADRLGFTRSVITSALKKLEGASLIETRSLGMKGTYIRIKDILLVEEMKKL